MYYLLNDNLECIESFKGFLQYGNNNESNKISGQSLLEFFEEKIDKKRKKVHVRNFRFRLYDWLPWLSQTDWS